jgi:RND family efflux transporter MFP subunit
MSSKMEQGMDDMNANSAQRKSFWFLRLWKLWLGLIAMGFLFVWTSGMLRDRIEAGNYFEFQPGEPLPEGAQVILVDPIMVPGRIDLPGTVASEQSVHLSARISASVEQVFASAGQRVEKGQTLIRLDDRELQQQLEAAKVALRQAEIEFERAKELVRTDAASQQTYDAAESAFLAAQSQVNRMEVMLTYTELQAPMDSIVTDRRVESGDLASPGQVLLTLYDPSRMRMEVAVPVRLVHHFEVGTEIPITLSYPEESLVGQVTEIVSEIDTRTRTRLVKIQLPDISPEILPGAYGRVWVSENPHEGILLPEKTIRRIGQLEFVELVEAGRVRTRMVKTGAVYDDMVEILSGLSGGESVLVSDGEAETDQEGGVVS